MQATYAFLRLESGLKSFTGLLHEKSGHNGEMSRLLGCATNDNLQNWSVVSEICSRVNQSDHEVEETLRALLHDIEFGRPDVQSSAAELCAVILRSCPSYVANRMPNQKLFKMVEGFVLGAKTPAIVRDRFIRAMRGSEPAFMLDGTGTHNPHQANWKAPNQPFELCSPPEASTINIEGPTLSYGPPRIPVHIPQCAPNRFPGMPDPERWQFETQTTSAGNPGAGKVEPVPMDWLKTAEPIGSAQALCDFVGNFRGELTVTQGEDLLVYYVEPVRVFVRGCGGYGRVGYVPL
ncbi:unnamed protein product, partial [Rhizoctonia solani]